MFKPPTVLVGEGFLEDGEKLKDVIEALAKEHGFTQVLLALHGYYQNKASEQKEQMWELYYTYCADTVYDMATQINSRKTGGDH